MANLTVSVVAERLGLNKATVYRRTKGGRLTLQEVLVQGGSKRPRIKPNEQYGHLTVVEVLPSSTGGNARVIARCQCGRLKEMLAMNLKSKAIIACGYCGLAPKKLHGQTGTRTYQSWMSMLDRCRNPNHKDWRYYGGIGVTVCPEWIRSFAAFFYDMGERPEGKTLDRIEPSGNYEPRNCRWATAVEQRHNRRSSAPP